jgi:ATP-dependent RNA helicase DDX3X
MASQHSTDISHDGDLPDETDRIEERSTHPLPSDAILQKIFWVEEAEKCSFLLDLLKNQAGKSCKKWESRSNVHTWRGLGPDASTLILVRTKKAVDMLEAFLTQHRHAVTGIHGGRMQSQREEALESFQAGRTQILVSSDIAVRGLGIRQVLICDTIIHLFI